MASGRVSLWPMLVLTVLMAGCLYAPGADPPPSDSNEATGLRPAAEWERDPCDPSGAAAIAGDLHWIAAWQGTPKSLATRFAAALGHELPPLQEEGFDGWWHWRADTYEIRYHDPEVEGGHPAVPELRYSTAARWPAGDAAAQEQELRRILERFGVPDDVDLVFDEGRSFVQRLHGSHLPHTRAAAYPGDGSGQYGSWSGFDLRPLYDPAATAPQVSETTAVGTAESYDRCALDRLGQTEGSGYVHVSTRRIGFDVRNASLVHKILIHYEEPPPPGHCGLLHWVFVDAQTGAVHGWERPPCD